MVLQLGVSKILSKIMIFLGLPIIIFDLIHPNFGCFVYLTPTNNVEKVPSKNIENYGKEMAPKSKFSCMSIYGHIHFGLLRA